MTEVVMAKMSANVCKNVKKFGKLFDLFHAYIHYIHLKVDIFQIILSKF